jgi:hypothetical protein
LDTGAAIHHLSHLDVAQWIEKTNRYTSRVDRERVSDDGRGLARFAHQRVEQWLSRTRDASPGGYPEAVSVLRATYDLIDRLKIWEEERGLDAAVEFQRVCASLDASYVALGMVRDRHGEALTAAPYVPRAVDEHEVLRRRLTHFRARHDKLAEQRDSQSAEIARLRDDLSTLAARHAELVRTADAQRLRTEDAETERRRVQAEAIAQRQRAEQAEVQLASLQDALDVLRGEHDGLRREHDQLKGSLRTFLRGYLPRLRRHALGQRP